MPGKIFHPSRIRIPEKLPVFPLPDVLLFPGVDLPLYIFEPRYRKMLADCSEGDKFMAISLFKPGWEKKKEPIPSFEVVGVGYVRAIFENPDGTSHILLRGITRAKIIRYVQMEPYRIARVEEWTDQNEDLSSEIQRLAERLKKLVSQKIRFGSEDPHFAPQYPKEFENPALLSYWACFLSQANPYLKQGLLEKTTCKARIRDLIRIFEEEIHPAHQRN